MESQNAHDLIVLYIYASILPVSILLLVLAVICRKAIDRFFKWLTRKQLGSYRALIMTDWKRRYL
jgi:uncharacterized membrane protein YbaN (DUF454 family)